MRPAPEVHDALACLLTYPGWEARGMHYPAAIALVSEACPETAEDLRAFSSAVEALSPEEREELYTRTFDNVAERSLEVGWQLFGENYARGALMVRLRAMMRERGVRETTELPDHMTNVLPLLARLPESTAAALAGNQVTQALEKMLEGLQSFESPWRFVLEATRKLLLLHRIEAHVPSEATP